LQHWNQNDYICYKFYKRNNMSNLRVDNITDEPGTGAPNFPNGITVDGTIGGTIIASQAEALTGTNNTKLMTPLRAAQSRIDPENRIINGAFDFWQRGTSTTTGGAYIADRWLNGASGGTVTMSRQSFTVGDTLGTNNPTYFLRQTVSGQTLSSSLGFAQQRIEGVRSYAGQTFTILGWARRSSGTGNMAVEIAQDFGTGGSPSSAVLLTPQTVTLTTSFAPFALTFTVPSITGKTLGTTGNDFLNVNFWTSAGSDYNARSNSLGIQTIGVDLWGIHIKVGTHTTDAVSLYRQPELGPELVRCLRYYEKSYPINTAPGTPLGSFFHMSAQASSQYLSIHSIFSVRKRANPSVVAYAATTGNAGFMTVDAGQVAVNVGGTETFIRMWANNVTISINQFATAHWVADAEFY
jgi:hypothetical protein